MGWLGGGNMYDYCEKNGVSFFWCTFETVKMSTTTTTYFVYLEAT